MPLMKPNDSHTLSPYLVYFLMYVSMVGVGILDFQREMIQHAGYNAWISVLLSGISIHIILWMIYKILSSDQDGPVDVMMVNRQCFGKAVGHVLNLMVVIYFFLGAFVTFRGYMAIIRVWLFPVMNMLPVSIVIVILIYYTVSGGLRSVTGLSFWGVLSSLLLVIPLNFLVVPYLHPQNLLPLYNHSAVDLLYSSKNMVFQYLGFEALLLIYPLIQTPPKSQKWAQLAVFSATVLYLTILLVTFMYYTERQLILIGWPTLHMIMILEIPLFQRLEYLVISVLFIKIAANVALTIWAACRGTKQAWHVKKRISLLVFMAGFIVLQIVIKDGSSLRQVTKWYSNVGFYFIYVYIPVLFVIVQIRKRFRPVKTN